MSWDKFQNILWPQKLLHDYDRFCCVTKVYNIGEYASVVKYLVFLFCQNGVFKGIGVGEEISFYVMGKSYYLVLPLVCWHLF